MGPKGKGGDKDKSKVKDASAESGGKVKGAQSLNVRHILCQKHAKKEEALAKLNDGVKFDEVARQYSEDKARAGWWLCSTCRIDGCCTDLHRRFARLEDEGQLDAGVRSHCIRAGAEYYGQSQVGGV